MAIVAQSLVDKVRLILQETTPGGMRWKDPEMLGWINDAQREIVLVKPNTGARNVNIPLVAGTLQTIPTDGVGLLKAVRNVSGSANTVADVPGRAIRISETEILDAENPDWHFSDPDLTVLHYMFDEDDPIHFFVYPPQPATPGHLNIVYAASPIELTLLAENISIRDIYANQVVDYVLFRCYLKDASYAGNEQRANNHYQLFRESLGLKAQVEIASSPNMGVEMSKQR
jgi:hypothetical protein